MGAPLNPSLPSHERDGPRDVPSGVERPRRGEVIHQHERHTQGPTGTPILTHTPRLADRPHLETSVLIWRHHFLLLAVQARKVQGVFVDAVLLGFIQPATLRRPDLPLQRTNVLQLPQSHSRRARERKAHGF